MVHNKPWVGGNWKCNGTLESIDSLIENLNNCKFNPDSVDVVVCPTALHLSYVKDRLNDSYKVCAQNCSKTANGAYTGEVSALMLKDLGVEWTLIGHSERRQYYGETNDVVAEKIKIAGENELNATLCIGESLKEREENKTEEVLYEQLNETIKAIKDWKKIVIAYEPVWAIGTGKVATPQQVEESHKAIRKIIEEKVNKQTADTVRVVYGGSVTAENCNNLISLKGVDGFLVGGASLKKDFANIIQSAQQKHE